MTRIAVLGPGGVGGFVAGVLAHAGEEVVVLAREETAERIASAGIRVRSELLGELSAHPEATAALTEDVDALIVATKATGLQDALGRVGSRPGVVVPLLNGLDHLQVLRRRFGGDRVLASVIRIDSRRSRSGEIVQSGRLVRVDMASRVPELSKPIAKVAAILRGAGIPVRIGESEAEVMWSKLVRLNALACTTTAADATIGFVRSDPRWRSVLVNCVSETALVARAEGAGIDPADTLAELEAAHPELSSSLRRDVATGGPTELDAIAGSVLRAGARHGIDCPTVADLAAQIARRIAAGAPDPASWS